jgi:uncharacterized protein involved in exopolysaccharide biosynthesis
VNNTGEILIQLIKRKKAILITGVIVALLGLVYTIMAPTTYTSTATLFPLTSSTDNSATSALSGILGGLTGGVAASPSNSFSSDASINIIELALSRTVRERVASSRLPQFQNKTVTELLLDQSNAHLFFWSKKSVMPDDSAVAATLGSLFLFSDIVAKINKNGVLELNYSNTDPALVQPISELFIAVISKFYIQLRTEKAQADYEFTLAKIDSLNSVLQNLDDKAIGFQNTTYFTSPKKLEYSLPQDNLSTDKQRLLNQQNSQIADKEQALWTLQKATPIIATLDHPNPPFDRSAPSPILFTLLGFIVGSMIASFFAVRKASMNYLRAELNKLIQQ